MSPPLLPSPPLYVNRRHVYDAVFTIVWHSHAPTVRYRHVTVGMYHVTAKTRVLFSAESFRLPVVVGRFAARADAAAQ